VAHLFQGPQDRRALGEVAQADVDPDTGGHRRIWNLRSVACLRHRAPTDREPPWLARSTGLNDPRSRLTARNIESVKSRWDRARHIAGSWPRAAVLVTKWARQARRALSMNSRNKEIRCLLLFRIRPRRWTRLWLAVAVEETPADCLPGPSPSRRSAMNRLAHAMEATFEPGGL
jgi:hypothetical protein